MQIINGQTVTARGRDWTVVCAPEGDVDLLIADPHFTDVEREQIRRVEKVNEFKRTSIPHGVYAQRSVLDLSEIKN